MAVNWQSAALAQVESDVLRVFSTCALSGWG